MGLVRQAWLAEYLRQPSPQPSGGSRCRWQRQKTNSAITGQARRQDSGAILNGSHLDIIILRHHDAPVRTTLTLDDDVAAKLKELARRKRVPFKEAVNTVLRRGLVAPEVRRARNQRFRVEVFNSPFRSGVDPLRLNQLSDELEAEEFTARMRR